MTQDVFSNGNKKEHQGRSKVLLWRCFVCGVASFPL